MISILSLMLIPFGSNKYTSFITQKVINAIISLGVKLMVLAFIVSASLPMIKLWSTPSNVGLEDSLYILLGSAALAFLSWHAPNLASSLMSGMPSLNASSIISPAISTANSAVVTAATMGAGAPAAIAAAGGSGAGSAVKAANKNNIMNKKTIVITTVILAVMIIISTIIKPKYYINLSCSIPRGIYKVIPFDGQLKPGDIVIFDPPVQARPYVYGRAWLPKGWPLIKPVGAITGDEYQIKEHDCVQYSSQFSIGNRID